MSRPDTVELLAALVEGLRQHPGKWYLFGAQAVVAYGLPRMTADVDITIDPANRDAGEILRCLEPRGFRLRVPEADDFVARTRVLPLVHEPTAIPLDVVLAGPGLEEEFLGRAQLMDVGGVTLPLISVEDLLVTKILAGRPKDLEDVRGILVSRGKTVDLGRVRRLLRKLESALGQDDLLPALKTVLVSAKKPRSRKADDRV